MPHLALNGWFIDQPHTGTGQYLHHLLKQLPVVAPDFQVSLVAPAAALAGVTLPDGIQAVPIASGQGSLAKVRFEQQLFPAVCRTIKADLAHVPHWATPLGSPIPVVTTIHDLIPLLMPEHRGKWRVQLYTALVTAAAKGSTHIITVSEAARRDVLQYFKLPHERVTAVLQGVDESFNSAVSLSKAVREKYGLPESYVLYLGGFQRRKNVHQLIGAWTWVAPSVGEQIKLVIAGQLPAQPDGRLFYDLPALVDELKLNDYIEFIGAVDEADKPALYAGADAFVFPSVYEGFGLPPLEAMACGTVVVTTDKGSLPEVVGNAAYLIPDPSDTRLMGAAILAVLVNGDLAADLRTKGLRQARQFSWRRTAEETVAVYRQVLKIPTP